MSDTCKIESQPGAKADELSMDPGPGKHVLFFGDPMCSWCWGFAPELQHLTNQAQGRAQFHVVMGGLRPGTIEPWDEAMRGYIRHHWQEVQAKTGQPFDFTRFEDSDFIYDTEPACRAVITVREHAPDKTLAMYDALQRAFYAENRNVTDPDVLAELAANVGVDHAVFLDHFHSGQARAQVAFDFQRTQAFGVQGFPSVLCAEDGKYGFLALGYRPYADMRDDFRDWLAS